MLGARARALRDPASAERRAARARSCPRATGFQPATVREGLERGLAPWTARSARRARRARARRARHGPPRVRLRRHAPSCSAARSRCRPCSQLIAPLALGSPVLVRPGVARSRHRARGRGRARAASTPRSGAASSSRRSRAPTRGDARVRWRGLRRRDRLGRRPRSPRSPRACGPRQRFVGHGHRFSVAVLGEAAPTAPRSRMPPPRSRSTSRSGTSTAASRRSRSTSLGVERAPDALVSALGDAFAAAAARWPRGAIAPRATAPLRTRARTAELRAAAGADVRRGPRARLRAAWREPDARLPRLAPPPLPPGPPRAGCRVALAAAGAARPPPRGRGRSRASAPSRSRLEPELAALGASRVCPLGALQAPPLDWSHDGQGVLLPLARLTDVEEWSQSRSSGAPRSQITGLT